MLLDPANMDNAPMNNLVDLVLLEITVDAREKTGAVLDSNVSMSARKKLVPQVKHATQRQVNARKLPFDCYYNSFISNTFLL